MTDRVTMTGMGDDDAFTGWRKPRRSFSNGNCAEVATFRKSSRSTYNGSCLEAGSCCHGVAVRDSKDPDGPVLAFGGSTWGRFTAALKRDALTPA